MPRPIQAIVHLDALRHNLEQARCAAPDARVLAIVKAHAYGHGLEHCFQALRAADGFGLLDIAEAQHLRELGWQGPILLLEGCFDARDLEWCSRLHLWHVVHTSWQIDALARHKTHQPHRVFLKLNAGMNRLGFSPAAFRAAWTRLQALPQVGEVTLMTHFANADQSMGVAAPLAVFEDCTQDLPGERSLCNSAATLCHAHDARVQGDWVRCGIMLYGSSPDYPHHTDRHWNLQPAMSLRSELIAVQSVAAGQAVGYGGIYTAPAAVRVGIVACGYGDGYPRVARTGTPVLVEGVLTHTLGRVSMDMLAVDLSPVPHAEIGSEVVLWGRSQGGAVLSIDVIASAAQTLGYELMCALAPRVPVSVCA